MKIVFLAEGEAPARWTNNTCAIWIARKGTVFHWTCQRNGDPAVKGEEGSAFKALMAATEALHLAVKDWMTLENVADITRVLDAGRLR